VVDDQNFHKRPIIQNGMGFMNENEEEESKGEEEEDEMDEQDYDGMD
jgi:hypothetical protein